ncbi:MAG: family 2 glycosyl transferase [Cyanobacteria bacterium J06648_11]
MSEASLTTPESTPSSASGFESRSLRVAILIINRDQPEMTDSVVEQVREMGPELDTELFVVECGSRRQGRSKYATHWFRDPSYRGRYYGFNRALDLAKKHAKKHGAFDYYWFVVNDIIFPAGQDVLMELLEVMEANPQMAAIGPGEPDSDDYEGCHPKPGRRWHKASTVHGLAWLMSAKAIAEVGYCSRKFRYSQGASTELAYKLYKAGWFLAYSDVATLQHRGTSTYGKVVKISRHEYLRRSRDFATKYFVKTYGENWDELFSSVLTDDVDINMFPIQRKIWEKKFKKERGNLWFWKTGSWIKQRLLRLAGKQRDAAGDQQSEDAGE